MMETFAIYLIKSGALIALFFIAYAAFLRRETFFRGNRRFLIAGLLTALLLPLVTFRKIVWLEPLRAAEDWTSVPMPADAVIAASENPAAPALNWPLLAAALYGLVMLALLVKFLRDFYALRRLLRGKAIRSHRDYRFVDVSEPVAPFSYFRYIVYNSSLYSEQELLNILEHEKVHSKQRHTLDVLLMRVVCIVFWWNPFAWLYRKAILQNLEFIADSEAAKKIADLKSYQFTLLKITAHENCVPVTNPFFQSLIKKRIVMLNKNQSSKWKSWKYALILPALAAFLFLFQVKVIAQERNNALAGMVFSQESQAVEVVVDKNTSDSELKRLSESLKTDHDIKLKFSRVKRNNVGEITGIKAEFRDRKNGKTGSRVVAGDQPIEPIRFFKEEDGAIGFSSLRGPAFARNWIGRANDREKRFSFVVDRHDEGEEPSEVSVLTDQDSVFVVKSGSGKGADLAKVIVKSKDGKKHQVIVNGAVVADFDSDAALAEIEPIVVNGFHFSNDDDEVVVTGNNVRVNVAKGKQLALHKESLKAAKLALERSRPDMEQAKADFARAKAELKRAGVEAKRFYIEDGRQQKRQQELDEARQEIEDAREEIVKAKAEIEKMRAELEKERKAAKK